MRRRLIAIAVAGAILASGVVATAQSLRASENGVDTAFVFAQRSCSQQDATTICLHPGYEGYRPLVMDLVDRFNSGLPKGVPGPTFIVQKLLPYYPHESDESNEPSAAVIGPRWGRGEAAAEYEFGLALQLAVAVVGIPVGEFEFEPSRAMRRYYEREFAHVLPPRETTDRCYAMGEARAVLALWLAARTTPGAEDYLRDQARVYVRPPRVIGEGEHQRVLWCCDIYAPGSREPGARVLFNHRMTPGARELEYAVALLDVAPERVLSLWERWIEPTTSTEQAIRSVGLQSLPTKREILRREGIDHVPLLHDDPGQNEPRCRDVEGG